MALQTPLNPGGAKKKGKASMFYNPDDYIKMLEQTNVFIDDDLQKHLDASPDSGKVDTSRTGTRGHPPYISNLPDPMPRDLAFMFTKVTPDQQLYMWNWYAGIFFCQCLVPITYAFLLNTEIVPFWLATSVCGICAWQLCIQNVYILHDCIHGNTIPPYQWMVYITHCWADFLSVPWQDISMEHMQHHTSTQDLLIHNEFGWDPSNWLYWPNENPWWKITTPLVLPWHFFGANDTGALFAMLWWLQYPFTAPGGKCATDFWNKWFPRRLRHNMFVWWLWGCVYLLGTNTDLGGLKFMLIVSAMMRSGFASAWIFIVNFNHSETWNKFLATNESRTWEALSNMMAYILGGKHRWNEILFHDLHHAFPNAVGTLSMRGRFYGWEAVHDAALKILGRGIFKDCPGKEPRPETTMNQHQRRRSIRHEEKKKMEAAGEGKKCTIM